MHDFDAVIDRRGTSASKWDKYAGRDVLPFWVADMDFRTPDFILDALTQRIRHGIFGYTEVPAELIDAARARLADDYGWHVLPEWLVCIPGVVPGLNLACRAVGARGDSVLVPVPVYYPFLSAPGYAERVRIEVPLELIGARWEVPTEPLGRAMRSDTRLLLLCNPQNPTGRVYDRSELEAVADFCMRRGLVICSDEIHCALVLDADKRHVPIATLAPEVAARTITLIAATKAYNIPGLACGFAVIPDSDLRAAFTQARAGLVHGVGPLEYAAATAAYRDRSTWLASLVAYLRANRDRLQRCIARLPGVSMAHVEATCLAWIDVRALALDDPGAFFERHGLGLSIGEQFGGPGFVRFNFGCPRVTLEEGLSRFERAVESAKRG